MAAPHSKMYQPTPEEIANVYSRMNDTLKAPYYERAREILQDVNKNFIFDLSYGWFVRSSSQPDMRTASTHATNRRSATAPATGRTRPHPTRRTST